MTVDPTEPDTFAVEKDGSLDAEIPEADAAEQQTELRPREDEPVTHVERDSANEADSSEQARVVALDEDDYR
ncbi:MULTISPECIES: hypothetical protein [unclassified Streptomyces]|uniref:hypothetical protein n=1 Tax=unclassified Streptomyces TaxID=2593676 RepID=UPI001660C805|nr:MULTISPECIES: hypothetical protein [unclassified Streptomyces]MBD0706916.1 hypothetical protein [Streptomyces sp. CBMA291]MBD0716995.1 hypothetical protein [Streptomyces sp. CBMA370]